MTARSGGYVAMQIERSRSTEWIYRPYGVLRISGSIRSKDEILLRSTPTETVECGLRPSQYSSHAMSMTVERDIPAGSSWCLRWQQTNRE